MFIDRMPFNQFLGIRVNRFDAQQVEVSFDFKPEFVGNPVQKILHGGVTSSVLDTVGGMMVAAHLLDNMDRYTPDELKSRFSTLGTIDMRTDFLRPGRGEVFTATGQIIRSGNKVAVTRTEMHNETGMHIAFGTGTYMVG